MREFGRDLIRGGHCGQRSCEPHKKAEHMAAPTNAAKREKSSCQPAAVHTWQETEMLLQSPHIRCWGKSGPGSDAARGLKMTRTSIKMLLDHLVGHSNQVRGDFNAK